MRSCARWSSLLTLLLAASAAAQNLSFLRNSTVSNFNDEDVNIMLKNAAQALESSTPKAMHQWSNPKTGASGDAQVQGEFVTADGTLCKRLRVTNQAGGAEGQGTYTICKDEKRGWLLNHQAAPASAKQD